MKKICERSYKNFEKHQKMLVVFSSALLIAGKKYEGTNENSKFGKEPQWLLTFKEMLRQTMGVFFGIGNKQQVERAQ